MNFEKCPECGKQWRYKHTDGRTYSHLIGIEDWEKYDGVSYWQCPFCITVWDAVTGEKVVGRVSENNNKL